MPQIKITDKKGIEHCLEVVGDTRDAEEIAVAHGFDPNEVTIKPPQEYVVRRTSEEDYQLETPTGNVLLSTTYQTPPTIPEGIAEDIVTYAENNGSGAMHELRKMMLIGFRYVDGR